MKTLPHAVHIEWIDERVDDLGRRSFFANWRQPGDGRLHGQAFFLNPAEFARHCAARGDQIFFPGESGHKTWEALVAESETRV